MKITTKQLDRMCYILLYLHQFFLFSICSMCIWGDLYFGYELGSLYTILGIFIYTIISGAILFVKKKMKNGMLVLIVLINIIIDIAIVKSVVHW